MTDASEKPSLWSRMMRLFGRADESTYSSDVEPPTPEETKLQRAMFEGLRDFHGTVAREVMVPRTEIRAVDENQSQEDAVALILESGFSRLPVFETDIDHVTGIVHAKDLLRCLRENCADRPLSEIMRPPYFVPETKKVSELLSDFKRRRLQMAIILDEYGGTAGLVTIEDLIEEIVGEIEDEYDAGVTRLVEVSPAELLVSARVELHDVEEFFDTKIDADNATTVGGWIFERTGYIPAVDEELDVDGFHLKVESADERRIGRVRIVRQDAAESAGDDAPD